MKATLILANGTVFSGTSIGSTSNRICELVFNTSMVGYQEILTDPSYAGQGIVMSYPLIGNYGVNSADNESSRPWAEICVVRHLSPTGSNFRCEDTLDAYLKQHDISGIEGIDTRALTKILRSQGSMNAMLTCAEHFNIAEVLDSLKNYRITGAVERVSAAQSVVYPAVQQQAHRVALLDCGVTQNNIEALRNRGCEVTRFPAGTSAESILAGGFDGALLSNGPGDPAELTAVAAEVKKLYDAGLPLFGIGLGHQLLAIATGAKTQRMLHGHRGANYPVRDLATGRVYITGQNHGYCVSADSLDPNTAQPSHVNVNDGTVEGLRYQSGTALSAQFSPESNTSSISTAYLFDRFVALMGGAHHA